MHKYRQLAAGLIALTIALVVVSACGAERVSSPEETSGAYLKWGWDEPLGTSGQYDPGCNGPCPPPVLNCSASVLTRGAFLSCSVYVTPMQPTTEILWNFDGPLYSRSGQSNVTNWAGTMLTSGTISVQVIQNGEYLDPVDRFINVTPRSGWSWVSRVSGSRASPGELDICITSGLEGLTAGVSCTGQIAYFLYTPAVSMVSSVMQTARVSDGGPNHGLWYMTAGFASADIRSQVKSYWRADHPGFPLSGTVAGGCQNAYGNTNNRNVFSVNTSCMGNSSTYNAWLNGLWTHEDRHRNVAVPAAKTPSLDVGLLWEGLLGGSQSELIGFATAEFSDSEVLVRNQSLLTHTGNLQYFNLWSFGGAVWGTSNYSVDL